MVQDLLGSEIEVACARRHWLVLARPPAKQALLVLIGSCLVLFAVFGSVEPAVVTPVAGGLLIRIAGWRKDRVILTDRRVMRISGVFTTRQAHMSLRRVTDVTTEQTALGRVLGYASIDIESASKHPALSRLTYLASPNRFLDALNLYVYGTEVDLAPAADSDTVPLPLVPSSPRRSTDRPRQ